VEASAGHLSGFACFAAMQFLEVGCSMAGRFVAMQFLEECAFQDDSSTRQALYVFLVTRE
jgi:hypothetical protein